jgi:hypothetical protein
MTRRSDPPVVLVKWYDFTKWVLGHVDNFPKNQRFVFGQRLADGVITILELIVDATYSERKSKILLEVNRRLEVLRWLLRLAFDRRLLAGKQAPGSKCRKTNDEFRLTRRGIWFLLGTPLFYHHLRPACCSCKVILGDLGIENGKLRMENY